MDIKKILESLDQLSEATKETPTGKIHKAEPGGYGRKFDTDEEGDEDKKDKKKKAEPAEKRGRGRPPKEGGESDKKSKEIGQSTKALQSFMVGNLPKGKLPGKATTKHTLKDWIEIVKENQNVSVEPLKQQSSVVKKNGEVVAQVDDPNLARQIQQGLSSGKMSISGEQGMDEAASYKPSGRVRTQEIYDKEGNRLGGIIIDYDLDPDHWEAFTITKTGQLGKRQKFKDTGEAIRWVRSNSFMSSQSPVKEEGVMESLGDSNTQDIIIDTVERLFRKNEISDYGALEAIRQGVKHYFTKPNATTESAIEGILNILDKRMSKSGNYVDLGRFKEALRQGVAHKLKKQGVAEGQLDELKKSTVKSYADKKQAELDDVPPMPLKKPARSKSEIEKDAKGMMGALSRLSGKKPTSEGVAEGYILKKTNVDKYMEPGDPDEYTQDINIKDTDYEIINNKTGQVVGTASWTTNDFMGPGALKITMKNGATRWLDIWASEKGNPQSAFNRFVKDPKTAKKYKEQGVAEGSDELYQNAIRSYTELVAHNCIAGGSDYIYGVRGFDSEMFGVDPKQAQKDFDRLFPQYLKKLQDGEQGVMEGSSDDSEAKAAYMHGLRHGSEGIGNNMDRAKAEWGDNFKHYNAGFLKGRNKKAKSLKAVGQGYGKRQQGVAEGSDEYGFHTSVSKGKFLPSKYGQDENNLYLHDLMNVSGDGSGPQLVTINDKRIATELAAMYGGYVEKTGMGTYRVYQPRGARQTTKKPEQQGVAEGFLNEGQYEMMMSNGQVKKFIAKDDADAKRIAKGHGAKSVIRLKGGVPAGKVTEQGVAEDITSTRREVNLKKKIDKGVATPEQKKEYQELKAKNMGRPAPKQGVAEGSEEKPPRMTHTCEKCGKKWQLQHHCKGAPNKKQGVAEGSGPKEKQKTLYRDINSAEYRAAADKQKQQMAKDKLAEPGKKLLAKKGVAEADMPTDQGDVGAGLGAGRSQTTLEDTNSSIFKGTQLAEASRK